MALADERVVGQPRVRRRAAALGLSARGVFGVLVGYLAAFRVLMVWVYDRTGSLLLAMLMHMSLTASVLILDPAAISGVDLLTYSFALAAAVWTAVAVVAVRNGWYRSRRPLRDVQRAA